MQTASQILSQITEDAKNHEFLKTGFDKFDEFLNGGLIRKELVTLGANTGIGKSYFAGQVFHNIAQQGFLSAYFSLEISNATVLSRLIGAEANIMPIRIQYGNLTKEEYEDKLKAVSKVTALEDFMHFYDDIYNYEKIEAEIIKNGYEFVVVDFVQNIELKSDTEYTKLSDVSRNLQKLAKKQNISILLLSQLSNAVARESENSEALDYKGSGGIKIATDLGLSLRREPYLEGAEYQELQLSVRKNRRGVTGIKFPMRFKFPGGKIYEK